jgi:hypothetical protein
LPNRRPHHRIRNIRAVALIAGAGGAVAVSSLPASATAAAQRSPEFVRASSAANAAGTRAKIKANWIAFFSGTTPTSRKIALLQNGTSFASIIRGQAATGKGVAATVARVTLISASKANVRYTLDLGGKPVLTNQLGQSVLQSGTWKVGVHSFCTLLALEQVKTPSCSASSSG